MRCGAEKTDWDPPMICSLEEHGPERDHNWQPALHPTCRALSSNGDRYEVGCLHAPGHAGPHQNRNGYLWPQPAAAPVLPVPETLDAVTRLCTRALAMSAVLEEVVPPDQDKAGWWLDVLEGERGCTEKAVVFAEASALATVHELLEQLALELARIRRGDWTPAEIHDLCHRLPQTVSLREFAEGCHREQQRIYGAHIG